MSASFILSFSNNVIVDWFQDVPWKYHKNYVLLEYCKKNEFKNQDVVFIINYKF